MTVRARSGGGSTVRDRRQMLGRSGEAAAAAFLRKRLYTILETNFRSRYGEIDIIARRGDIIAFVEVKSRRHMTFGKPFEAVGARKQDQLRRMASAWLAINHTDPAVREAAFRFDVIAITVDGSGGVVELEHIKDAFR